MNLYSVFEHGVGAGPIVMFENDVSAVRAFATMFFDLDRDKMNPFISNYDLIIIGTFDSEEAHITALKDYIIVMEGSFLGDNWMKPHGNGIRDFEEILADYNIMMES